ncbi:hypothetical protein B3C1_10607 [Gallaecimonas xiamenensis 3-C-1]|uniref:Uncharacterized protein n=2 Tax=Gallaecimonas TaxID=745410 RepID=K2IS27_9GAMM|nr:hypothetical protein B3C1_10607 [Gallaecimonas xiamenensis 3-C-1]
MPTLAATAPALDVQPGMGWYEGQAPDLPANLGQVADDNLVEVMLNERLTLGFGGQLQALPVPGEDQTQSPQADPGFTAASYQFSLKWRF